ncbi:MAG: nucleotidyl transferase AbiEii/AbiGii toxin family protein [Stackebrandtia sp.]
MADKGVTILERGITSTRWRDYIDIVQLAEVHPVDAQQLLVSAPAVARYRKVELGPIARAVVGYGETGQARWAAWRRKEQLEEISEANLDDQMVKVAAVLDPVFSKGP